MQPLQLLPIVFIGACLIVLVAGFVQSLTGFGFAIVSVPFLVLLLDPKVAVQVSLILGLALSAAVLLTSFKPTQARLRLPLLLGSLVGIPLGSLLLMVANSLLLRLMVGATGFILALFILRGFVVHIPHESIASAVVGVLSGALNSATSYGGVPVALFLTNQGSDKMSLRTNMLTYLLMANMMTLIVLSLSGLLAATTILLSLQLVPALLLGLGLGAWVFPRIDANQFSRIVLKVVLATSVTALVSAIYSYIHLWGIL